MKEHSYFVYILHCSDGTYYVGISSDLPARLSQHQLGVYEDAYTFLCRPVQLVYSTEFTDVYEAISWERKVKRWSKAKKLALIQGNWDALIQYSKKIFKGRHPSIHSSANAEEHSG